MTEQQTATDFWTDADVIFTYTDKQAVEDGVLVDLEAIGCSVTFHGRTVNRMTAHLFYDLIPYLIDADHGNGRQPSKLEDLKPGHIRSLRQMLQTKLTYARDTAYPCEQRDYLYELPGAHHDLIWIVRNELGGFTVMFASDY